MLKINKINLKKMSKILKVIKVHKKLILNKQTNLKFNRVHPKKVSKRVKSHLKKVLFKLNLANPNDKKPTQ